LLKIKTGLKTMRIPNMTRYLKAESGIAAIEFAFIMPFLLLLFFGLVDVTDAVSHNRRITSVANSIGDLAAQNRKSILKTQIDDYFKAASLIMKPDSDSDVRVRVYGYRKNGASAELKWVIDNGKGAACSKSPDLASMPALMTQGNDLVVSQACMVYNPVVTSFLGTVIMGTTSMKIEQIISMRPRASTTLDCYMTAASPTPNCPAS
jgi:Flp pilus assembly protein TadG